MPRFEYRCFLTVHADSREEADKAARECCDEFECAGEFSFALDDGEPDIDEDE